MKYHAEDTSTLNGPRWFNCFRVGCAEPAAVPTIWSSDAIPLRLYPLNSLNILNTLNILNVLNKLNQSE